MGCEVGMARRTLRDGNGIYAGMHTRPNWPFTFDVCFLTFRAGMKARRLEFVVVHDSYSFPSTCGILLLQKCDAGALTFLIFLLYVQYFSIVQIQQYYEMKDCPFSFLFATYPSIQLLVALNHTTLLTSRYSHSPKRHPYLHRPASYDFEPLLGPG